MIGSSYRSHDNTIPGRRMMTPPSRELAAQMATPPKKVADSTNSEWIQSQKKLQTVFGADQKLDQFDNVRNLVQTSARVATVVTGELSARGDVTARSSQVMRGYTGHVPGARHVIATGYRGFAEGNAYRGPKSPSAPYVPPTPPNKCSEGP